MLRRTIKHTEKHFSASLVVRDVVIGMADGLTVPFALAAGLAGAVSSNHLVVVAGLAEIAAGAIAMGLGGYLAARTETEHYQAERQREDYEVVHMEAEEREETSRIFAAYGLSGEVLEKIVDAVATDKQKWIDFMMRYELGLDKPMPHRAALSAATIGGSYIVGGIIPLCAYIVFENPHAALAFSSCLTGLALIVFGAIKAKLTHMPLLKGACQTFLTGGLAAVCAYAVAKAVT